MSDISYGNAKIDCFEFQVICPIQSLESRWNKPGSFQKLLQMIILTISLASYSVHLQLKHVDCVWLLPVPQLCNDAIY